MSDIGPIAGSADLGEAPRPKHPPFRRPGSEHLIDCVRTARPHPQILALDKPAGDRRMLPSTGSRQLCRIRISSGGQTTIPVERRHAGGGAKLIVKSDNPHPHRGRRRNGQGRRGRGHLRRCRHRGKHQEESKWNAQRKSPVEASKLTPSGLTVRVCWSGGGCRGSALFAMPRLEHQQRP